MFVTCRCVSRVNNFKTLHGLYKYFSETVVNATFFLFLFNSSKIKSYVGKTSESTRYVEYVLLGNFSTPLNCSNSLTAQ